jgi:hypothetical protein
MPLALSGAEMAKKAIKSDIARPGILAGSIGRHGRAFGAALVMALQLSALCSVNNGRVVLNSFVEPASS